MRNEILDDMEDVYTENEMQIFDHGWMEGFVCGLFTGLAFPLLVWAFLNLINH